MEIFLWQKETMKNSAPFVGTFSSRTSFSDIFDRRTPRSNLSGPRKICFLKLNTKGNSMYLRLPWA